MNELKPCPFCGGEAEAVLQTKVIHCKKCKITFFTQQTAKDRLIEAWNRRAGE